MPIAVHVVSALPPSSLSDLRHSSTWADDDLIAVAHAVQRSTIQPRDTIVLLGTSTHAARARHLGLTRPVLTLCPPSADPRFAARQLRAIAPTGHELVIWGSPLAADLAEHPAPGDLQRRVIPTDPGDDAALSFDRRGHFDLIAIAQRAILRAARPSTPVVFGEPLTPVHSPRPLTSHVLSVPAHRPTRHQVTILLAGRAPHADALRFTFLIGLLLRAGLPVRGVMQDSAAWLARARRYGRYANLPFALVDVSSLSRRELLPRVDLAVWVGAGEGPTRCAPPHPGAADVCAADCFVAGVPLVAPAWAVSPAAAAESPCVVHHAAQNATIPELARVLVPLVHAAHSGAAIPHADASPLAIAPQPIPAGTTP